MASKIDPGQAKSLIQEFKTQNEASGDYAWKTPDGQYLRGFFLDRESLEEMLKNDEVVGVHVYFAKHPDFSGKPDCVNTIIYMSAELNPEPGEPPYINTDDCWCGPPPPCPPFCIKF